MTRFPGCTRIAVFLALAFPLAGCRYFHHTDSSQPTLQPALNQSDAVNPADPAAVNMASSSAPAAQPAPQSASAPQSAPAQTGVPTQVLDASEEAEPPAAVATDAPPPLPDYQQPPAPDEGYLWTPGYWGNGGSGYYWVPGAWVRPPYAGALWTPGYWGWGHNRYEFRRGYWGPHVGFYGGVNYGFGYTGVGYWGGYWRDGNFFYNRQVNRISADRIHHFYDFAPRRNDVRIGYYGGPGGIQVRMRPEERMAFRERRSAPMQEQLRHEEVYRGDRNQLYSNNHGRPGSFAVERPIEHGPGPMAHPLMQSQEVNRGQPRQEQFRGETRHEQSRGEPQHPQVHAQPSHEQPRGQGAPGHSNGQEHGSAQDRNQQQEHQHRH